MLDKDVAAAREVAIAGAKEKAWVAHIREERAAPSAEKNTALFEAQQLLLAEKKADKKRKKELDSMAAADKEIEQVSNAVRECYAEIAAVEAPLNFHLLFFTCVYV